MNQVEIEVEGLDELMDNFHKAPRVIGRHLVQGMTLAIDTVLDTKGLRNYPPAGEANRPPAPYYKRGVGLYRRGGTVARRSERLGTQFYAKTYQFMNQIVGIAGQRASYGQWVVGESQPEHMRRKGWKRMKRVFELNDRLIGNILERSVAFALWKLKLLEHMAAADIGGSVFFVRD